jgi:hypothetical protein
MIAEWSDKWDNFLHTLFLISTIVWLPPTIAESPKLQIPT